MRLLKHEQKEIAGGAAMFAILGAVAIGINVLVGIVAGAINIYYAAKQAPIKPMKVEVNKPVVEETVKWSILPSVNLTHQLYYQSN
ncbi:hypothetical protein JM47_03030 [Ureaplasma diversum]|uniref:Uncharacterized protein n=1 Tax=Ureaplasma diversum TaxID=42094 RepID=A0A0C5RLF9_9BACT|nr:hypothetical protein JM47_03030 [Ureaplasma diversum]